MFCAFFKFEYHDSARCVTRVEYDLITLIAVDGATVLPYHAISASAAVRTLDHILKERDAIHIPKLRARKRPVNAGLFPPSVVNFTFQTCAAVLAIGSTGFDLLPRCCFFPC